MNKLSKLIAVWLLINILACAGPAPMLRPNAKFQLHGREAAKLDIAACQQKAEATGLKPGTADRSGNVAAGAGLGLVAGAAVGASAGIAGGPTGIAVGAGVGSVLGAIIGSLGGGLSSTRAGPALCRCGRALFDREGI